MTGQVVLKWPVPIDDRDHPIGSGAVVLVDVVSPETLGPAARVVYVWTLEQTHSPEVVRARVYGTGQTVPRLDVHLGSTVDQLSGLVWHVFGGTDSEGRPSRWTE